jgi:hypothetical protein
MNDSTPPKPWVCPWRICNHDEAQACRAEPLVRKGCGGRFPPDMTPEQAAEVIKRPLITHHQKDPS